MDISNTNTSKHTNRLKWLLLLLLQLKQIFTAIVELGNKIMQHTCHIVFLGTHTYTHTLPSSKMPSQTIFCQNYNSLVTWMSVAHGNPPERQSSNCFLLAHIHSHSRNIHTFLQLHTHEHFFKSICYFSKAVIIITIRSLSTPQCNRFLGSPFYPSAIPTTQRYIHTSIYTLLQ